MESLLFFIVGMLLMYLILRRPIKFEVHHKYENIVQPVSEVDMKAFEKEMLKEDPREDADYAKLNEVMEQLSDIMGGSDKINGEE